MKTVFVKQCHWCKTELTMNGKDADSYVVNAQHLIFCKIHSPGREPEKDCLDDYAKHKKDNPIFSNTSYNFLPKKQINW